MADIVAPRPTLQDPVYLGTESGDSEDTAWPVSRACLQARSPIFRDMQNGTSIKVPGTTEEDSLALHYYVQYLNVGIIPSMMFARKGSVLYDTFEYLYRDICRLYVLGAKIRDHLLQDDVMDALIACYLECKCAEVRVLPGIDCISYVWENTEYDSQLRRIITDMYVWAGRAEDLQNDHEITFPPAFVTDLAVSLLSEHQVKRTSRDIPENISCCRYHLHARDIVCGNLKRKGEPDLEARKPKQKTPSVLQLLLSPPPRFLRKGMPGQLGSKPHATSEDAHDGLAPALVRYHTLRLRQRGKPDCSPSKPIRTMAMNT